MQVSARLSSPHTSGYKRVERRKRASSFNDSISLRMRSFAIVNSRPSLPLERSTLQVRSDLIFRRELSRDTCLRSLREKKCDWIAPLRKRAVYIRKFWPRESGKRFRQAGVKCKAAWNSRSTIGTRVHTPPPPSKRNLADTMEYRIFNTLPGNAKRGARQWLFLGTDSRSFISTRRFLYTNRYAAVVVYAKAQRRHLRRENRERIHYAEVSVRGPLDPT